jgi:hypothetical protein
MMSSSTRRAFLQHLVSLTGMLAAWQTRGAGALPPMQVFKDPLCGCCSKWVDHMRANGFTASATDTDMGPIRLKHGITSELASCHTALVGGYIIEGHVPASDVKKLLGAKPKGIKGLTIPGMPASAPGMDVRPFQPYTVLAFDDQGKTSTYTHHGKAEF